ncbi:MFS transporter [Streptomyces sp. NPDC046557]|uniref:MFS transporter n=1 Tax=Streptomyces sp. NPDC046557 TaxID=3155372 RepID=UPI0034114AE4
MGHIELPATLPRAELTLHRRLREQGSLDRAVLDAILEAGFICHPDVGQWPRGEARRAALPDRTRHTRPGRVSRSQGGAQPEHQSVGWDAATAAGQTVLAPAAATCVPGLCLGGVVAVTGPTMPEREGAGAPAGRSWLTRNVKVLCGVSFLQDTASELLYPILPIFLTTVLGAPPAAVGIIEGVAEGAASLTKVAAGRLADRFSRRPLIGAGYGLAALGKLLIAVATVWPLVLFARCVDRLGKGLRGAPRDALLISGVPITERGKVFGLHRAADTAGAVVGPLIGLALYEALDQRLRPLFWVAVLPALASVALVAAVRDPRAPTAGTPRARPARIPWRALPRPYWRVLAALTAFGLVDFPDALLLLRAHDLGLSTAAVIAAYAAYNLTYAALSYPAGALSDRLPRALVFAAGLVFFAAGYLGLGLIHTPWLVFVILPLYGGFAACTDGVGKAWISSLVPEHQQGTAQGLYQGVTGAAVLIAGIWAGLAWHGDGRIPLLASGATALALAAVLPVLARATRSPTR